MKMNVTQDDFGTHMDWELENVTAKMVDWFWSNMEKCNLLWHPSQHEPLEWAVPPVHGNPIGSIHIAPQTWNDGTRQNLYIRFEDLKKVPDFVKNYIIYEHVVIAGGLGFGEDSLKNDVPFGYRLHQWEKTDYGIKGKSSGIGHTKKESKDEDMIWAAHCGEEIGNWGIFLPQMFQLYSVVTNTAYNPFADLSVEGTGVAAQYRFIK